MTGATGFEAKTIHRLLEVDPKGGGFKVVRLTEIFRQAAQSRVITSAHKINQGSNPDLSKPEGDSDCYFMQADDPETAVPRIKEVYNGDIGYIDDVDLGPWRAHRQFRRPRRHLQFWRARHTGPGLRGHDSQIPGFGIPRRRDSGHDAALPIFHVCV
jgi:ATP-dependent exoDNAse (exonuclease V) alpha subunit